MGGTPAAFSTGAILPSRCPCTDASWKAAAVAANLASEPRSGRMRRASGRPAVVAEEVLAVRGCDANTAVLGSRGTHMGESVPHALAATFRDDGSGLAHTPNPPGVAKAPFRDYWSNGVLACEGQYVNGSQEGEWRFYNSDGALREAIRFDGGREVVDWVRFLGRADSSE